MGSTLTVALLVVFWASASGLAYSYLLYPRLLRALAWRFGRQPASSASHTPTVAILIPAHDEEKIIERKLLNVGEIDYPAEKLSVWIGSDCSTDDTDAIVRSWATRDSRIRLWIAPERSGKSGILNALVPQVDAEILVFTDADTLLEPRSVRMLVRNFADPGVGGVAGLTLHRTTGADLTEEAAYRRFEAEQKSRESILHSTISAFGPFYAVRRSLFVPYHPRTYSNDDVMLPMNIIRQGYRMFFDAEAVSYEEATRSVTLEFKRRTRIGAGNYQAFFWLFDFLNPLKGWPWFCYVSHKVPRWFSPMLLMASAVACGALALVNAGVLYTSLFIAGAAVVLASLLHEAVPLPKTREIFYFLAMNAALLVGFFRFLRGIRSPVWARTEREAAKRAGFAC